MNTSKRIVIISILIFSSLGFSQNKNYTSSTEIFSRIQRLNFLGSVLYIAAHPDDENTKIISYMANKVHARTGYLSLTRGSGGQNLIGKEIGALLGVLRSEELLSARKVDGGEQFFSTAIDFGFSKHPEETFKSWNKMQTLRDIVRVIRKFRPDVIINRFDHRTFGTTHGHHTASAILSVEAFDKASDEKFVSDVKTWSPKRLYYNTSFWAYGGREKFNKVDKSKFVSLDVGVYYPQEGISNTEISANSRSFHRCQGFGTLGRRGTNFEYLEFIKGEKSDDLKSVFAGIDTSWNRLDNGKAIGNILYEVENNFDFNKPSKHIPKLLKAYKLITQIKDPYWRNLKTNQIKAIIKECAGLYLKIGSDEQSSAPGTTISANIEIVNRSPLKMSLKAIKFPFSKEKKMNISLENNKPFSSELPLKIASDVDYTTPYWLLESHSIGNYVVDNSTLIGNPRSPKVTASLVIDIEGVNIPFSQEVIYTVIDPTRGELDHPFTIVPNTTINFKEKVHLFTKDIPQNISLTVTSGQNLLEGLLSLYLPKGWEVQPKQILIKLARKGDSKDVHFKVSPPKKTTVSQIIPQMNINGKIYSYSKHVVDYSHIERQEVIIPASAKAIKFSIEKLGENIGYINGAGDQIPESLRQIGYDVVIIEPDQITLDYLKTFDAVVMGIRAYNVLENFNLYQDQLLKYVKEGGVMIVQYNTVNILSNLSLQNFSPYYLSLSRDRVVEENSQVQFINKRHPLLNKPNKITQDDFKDWVQERGLYFPKQWDSHFTPLLSMNDTGEEPKKGSLLVTPYGKGFYIYTGLSFFRELPAGVPGAYKLFANMLSIGKLKKKE